MNNLGFIYLFLPAAALVYYLTPRFLKTGWLLFASLLFYGFAAPGAASVALGLCLFDYACARALCVRLQKNCRGWAVMAVVYGKALAVFSVLGYLFFMERPVPMGIALVTLFGLEYLLALRAGEIEKPDRPADFLCYCLFFGRLYIGPLASAGELMPQLRRAEPNICSVGEGIGRFSLGLFKFIVLSPELGHLLEWCERIEPGAETVFTAWIWTLSSALLAYLTLSGGFDMAIGVGQVFSLRLPDGIRYPFQAGSLGDFARRFNLGAHDFAARRLLPSREGKFPAALRLAAGCLLTAAWFGPSRAHLTWGVVLALAASAEFMVWGKAPGGRFALAYKAAVTVIALASFALFTAPDLTEALRSIGLLFGAGATGLYSETDLYILIAHLPGLAVSLYAATDITARFKAMTQKAAPWLGELIFGAAGIVMLFISTVYLLGNAGWRLG